MGLISRVSSRTYRCDMRLNVLRYSPDIVKAFEQNPTKFSNIADLQEKATIKYSESKKLNVPLHTLVGTLGKPDMNSWLLNVKDREKRVLAEKIFKKEVKKLITSRTKITEELLKKLKHEIYLYVYYLEPLKGFHLQLTPEVKNWDRSAGQEYMKKLFSNNVKLDKNKNVITKEEFITTEDLRLKYPPKTENSKYFRYLNKVLL